jgi:hypothetical protein
MVSKREAAKLSRDSLLRIAKLESQADTFAEAVIGSRVRGISQYSTLAESEPLLKIGSRTRMFQKQLMKERLFNSRFKNWI